MEHHKGLWCQIFEAWGRCKPFDGVGGEPRTGHVKFITMENYGLIKPFKILTVRLYISVL